MIDKILDLSEYRGRFRKWLLDELIIRYPRRLNSLRFRDTIYLKGKVFVILRSMYSQPGVGN